MARIFLGEDFVAPIFKKLLARRDILLGRSRAAMKAFRDYKKPFAVFYEEDIFVATMTRRLKQYFPDVTQNSLLLQDICEAVYRELKGLEAKTRLESASGMEHEFINLIIQKFCLVAGVASAWELELKFFAGKIGIDVYYQESPGENLETKPVKKLVSEILHKYPKIDCRLGLCRDIRNGLVHGNLQQLRNIVLPQLSVDEKKELDPKMVVVSLSRNDQKSEMKWANDPFTKDEARGMGPFFWFLSGSNTRLLDRASLIMEKGRLDLGMIVSAQGLSFDETAGYFDQLAQKGKPWSAEQREIFLTKRGLLWGTGEIGKGKIEELHKLIRTK